MSETKITIVVPVYKVAENLLRRCLDSVVSQNGEGFEVLLIDDGTPDNGGIICDEYAQKYAYVNVIHQKNGGLAVVRNVGIDRAKGEWICFIDGDDWTEPGTVEFALNYIQEHPDADLLIWDEFCETKTELRKNYFLGDKNIKDKVYTKDNKKELFDLMLPEQYASSNPLIYADIGNCHARLYNVGFLRKNKLYNNPELRRMQDNVFSLWVFEKAEKICYKCKHLYHYSFNEEAATKKYNESICDNMNKVFVAMKEFGDECYPGAAFRQRIYTRFARLFLKIVELKHANPNNPNTMRVRLKQMEDDFSGDNFKEIIDSIQLEGQAERVRIAVILLRKKAYLSLYCFVKAITGSRNIRQRMRKK